MPKNRNLSGVIRRFLEIDVMMNSSMRASVPTLSQEVAYVTLSEWLDIAQGIKGVRMEDLTYCSWPETFANGSGPFMRPAGQAITTFRMEAWIWEQWAVVFCNGRVVRCSEFSINADWGKR